MLAKVKEIIAEHLNIEGIEITLETSLKDDIGADSLDLFELVMAFEEEYGIEIPPEELEGVVTIGDVLELMKKKGAK